MIRHFLLIFLMFLGTVGIAEPIEVRSGEHAAFTRLVFKIPAGARWKVGKTPDGYGLIVDGATSYELDNVFDRIPRQRIRATKAGDVADRLDLIVDCACRIDAFLFRPDLLVVDVQDGATDPESVFEQPLDDDGGAIPQSALVGFPLIPLRDEVPIINQTEVVERYVDPFAETLAQNEAMLLLEATIAENLARATSQGLLTPASIENEPEAKSEPSAMVHAADPQSAMPASKGEATSPGIRIQTSIDRDSNRFAPHTDVTQSGLLCWENNLVEVASWGNDASFADQIGQHWSVLTGEFDRPDPSIVEQLAKNLIYFGFGREARQVLQIDALQSKERMAIQTLGQIIDGDPVNPPIQSEMIGCDSDVALWAMLGQAERDLTAQPNRIAILRSLRSLPVHLQTQLGPLASDHFLAMGDSNAAEQALNVGLRSGDQTVALDLATIAIKVERGDTQLARDQLDTLANTNARMTPEALIELISIDLHNSETPANETLILAAAMRFENAGLPVAANLAAMEIEAHVSAGNFGNAQRILEEERSAIDPGTAAKLQNMIVSGATEKMPDAAFLEMAGKTTADVLDVSTANSLAARLLELGLPEIAGSFLDAPAIGQEMAERRYLRAKTALLREDFDAIDPILAGITTPRAESIRAAATARRTGYDRSLLSPETTEETAWREGNWQDLSSSEDALLADAVKLVLSSEPTGQSLETPLANGRALLAETGEMRAVIEGLLSRYDRPIPEAGQ